jgi:hypothetical protein
MKKLLLLFILTALFASCDDIFEKNIEKNSVEIITPQDSAVLRNGNIHFSWRNMEGALRYQLVIVTPTFDSVVQIVADTTIAVKDSTYVSIYNCPVNLSKGNYQWYIEAQNINYLSKKQIYDLTIIE